MTEQRKISRFDIEVENGKAYLVGNPDGKYVRYDDIEAAQPAPQRVAVAEGWLSEADMKALRRFVECCEDSDAGGHDVGKDAMKRLEKLGAVRSCGFGRHELTILGDAVLSAAPQPDGVGDVLDKLYSVKVKGIHAAKGHAVPVEYAAGWDAAIEHVRALLAKGV